MVEVIKLVKISRNYKDRFSPEDLAEANEEIEKLGGNVRVRFFPYEDDDHEFLGFEVVEI